MTPDPRNGLVQSTSGPIAPPITSSLQHPSTPFPTLVPSVADHELLRCIAGGSYGEGLLARNVLGEYRAVNVIYRNNFEHDRPFEREFEGIQKFEPISRTHPSQLNILHAGRNDKEGYFYYVMELADDAGENPKSEIRNPKQTRTPNVESEAAKASVRASGFGIASDFGIRNSDLYIPHTLK